MDYRISGELDVDECVGAEIGLDKCVGSNRVSLLALYDRVGRQGAGFRAQDYSVGSTSVDVRRPDDRIRSEGCGLRYVGDGACSE
jgi:hypothetical protein